LFELEKKLRQESSSDMHDMQVAQETRVHNALSKQEHELTSQFETNLEKEKSSITQNMEEQHTLEMARVKEAQVKQMLETQKEIKHVSQEISALDKVVASELSKTAVSASTHALAAAVLMAEDVLVQSAPAGKVIAALQQLSAAEPLVAAVVQTLPASAARKGVPVLDDIKVRFLVVREEARKAALAPEGTNPILAQMIGNFLSFVSIKPSGNVEGESVEATLARIDYYLESNKLDLALRETKSIRGYPRTLMSDWERMVHDRLVVDQAIRSLKTVSALRHLELS
jgi:mitofilin